MNEYFAGNDQRIESFFMLAPAAIAMIGGENRIYRLANPMYQQLYGRTEVQLIGKTAREVFPEWEGLCLYEIYENVFKTGEPYKAAEFKTILRKEGQQHIGYFDFVVHPIKNNEGVVTDIMIHAYDITEKVQARKKIEESEMQLKVMASAMPQVVWIAEADGDVIYYNDRVGEFEGARKMENGNWSWQGMLHPEDLQATLDAWANAVKNGWVYEKAHRIRMKNGEYHWHLSRALPQRNEDGIIIKWYGTATNIQNQKGEEQQIKESEERFRQMADMMPQMVWTARPDGTTDYYNKRWYEFTGMPEGYGGDESWLPVIHPDDMERTFEAWYDAVRNEKPYEIEYRFLDRKNPGGFRWFLGRALPVRDQSQKVIKWFGTCTDIDDQKSFSEKLEYLVAERTAQLQHEKEFIETILNSSRDAIAVFDKDKKYLTGNSSMEQRFGLKKEEYVGKHLLDVFPNLAGSGFMEDIEECLRGKSILKNSYQSQVMNRWFQNYFVPLKEADGTVYGAVVIGHDITDVMEASEKVKQANESLQQKNLELERSNKDLESFTYIASHDLQEPLRKIQTFIDLLKQSQDDEELAARCMEKIDASAQRMSSLIKSILTYSRLSYSKEQMVETDLNQLMEQVKNDFELTIREKNAAVTYNRLPVIKGVPLQLNQLFSNLLSNSLKFSTAQPVIHISSQKISPDAIGTLPGLIPAQEYVEIEFRDNGIGFEARYNEQVFKLFQRLHGKDEYSGTGIGLSIVKKIVERHNGVITAISEPGKGTSFRIWLPSFMVVE